MCCLFHEVPGQILFHRTSINNLKERGQDDQQTVFGINFFEKLEPCRRFGNFVYMSDSSSGWLAYYTAIATIGGGLILCVVVWIACCVCDRWRNRDTRNTVLLRNESEFCNKPSDDDDSDDTQSNSTNHPVSIVYNESDRAVRVTIDSEHSSIPSVPTHCREPKVNISMKIVLNNETLWTSSPAANGPYDPLPPSDAILNETTINHKHGEIEMSRMDGKELSIMDRHSEGPPASSLETGGGGKRLHYKTDTNPVNGSSHLPPNLPEAQPSVSHILDMVEEDKVHDIGGIGGALDHLNQSVEDLRYQHGYTQQGGVGGDARTLNHNVCPSRSSQNCN